MMVSRRGRTAEVASRINTGWRRLHPRRVAVAMLLAWMALPLHAAVARDPVALAARIPLAPMGFEPLSQEFLLAGSSMLTVDFVDEDHLLVTFGVRRLMKRDAKDPANDADRTVGAFLLELPSGKVLAQTEWRLPLPF